MTTLDDGDFDRPYTTAWEAMVRLACLLLGDLAQTLRISPGTVKSTASRAVSTPHARLEVPDARR